MRVIRADEYRTTAWKNGGGETTEIVAFPPGASLDGFDWRISRASISKGGPFSTFPGIDRTLTVLDGTGVRLVLGDGTIANLNPSSPPFAFDGGLHVEAMLMAGAVTDLNVMTRRGTVTHEVARLHVVGRSIVVVSGSAFVLYSAFGDIGITLDGRKFAFGSGDTFVCNQAAPNGKMTIEGDGEMALVVLRRSDG